MSTMQCLVRSKSWHVENMTPVFLIIVFSPSRRNFLLRKILIKCVAVYFSVFTNCRYLTKYLSSTVNPMLQQDILVTPSLHCCSQRMFKQPIILDAQNQHFLIYIAGKINSTIGQNSKFWQLWGLQSASPCQISRSSGQRVAPVGRITHFGPLSKNDTGMAALRVGLPVI